MKIINLLTRLLGYLSMGALVAMLAFIVVDVFARFLFNAPITGTVELSELMMVIIVFSAFAWCGLNNTHIKVDLLMSRFPHRFQVIIDTIMLLLALGIFAVMTWGTLIESMRVTSVTSLLRIPDAPFLWIMVSGLAVFCLTIIVLLLKNLTGEVER